MSTRVFWLPGHWSGRFGILSRPRGGDWLQDDVKAWRRDVDFVVSLLEPEEEAQLALSDEGREAVAAGIDFHAFPIPDRGVPRSKESVAALAEQIHDALGRAQNVAVHCRQGIGRSALIAGAVLIAAGQSPALAISTIEGARGLPVPETDEQRRWLQDFSEWFATRRKPEARPRSAGR